MRVFIIIYYRQEILSTHVPPESDEWMRLEMARLSQCTRIFPLEPKGDGKSGEKTEEEDKEEQEENDEENDDKQEKRKTENIKAAKSATYEEIIVQVITHDDNFYFLLTFWFKGVSPRSSANYEVALSITKPCETRE
jgi:hypothetical protein